jgi:hypothetical protein
MRRKIEIMNSILPAGLCAPEMELATKKRPPSPRLWRTGKNEIYSCVSGFLAAIPPLGRLKVIESD